MNSVPPVESEIVAGGIGRNFISRDLLEAASLEDAITVRFGLLSSSVLGVSVQGFDFLLMF